MSLGRLPPSAPAPGAKPGAGAGEISGDKELRNCDLVCFSHLRWGFVYQRPQHLLSRFAAYQRVFYFEEPLLGPAGERPRLETEVSKEGVTVVTPHLPAGSSDTDRCETLQRLIRDFMRSEVKRSYILWYYTPMALEFTGNLAGELCVYDCMDELANFAGAPKTMRLYENILLARADVVFTGGRTLFEAKRARHHNIHPFPSSIDRAHFDRASRPLPDPDDQAHLRRPRVGFYGVVDERLDTALVAEVARRRPDCSFIFLGPVMKIDPARLPKGPNLFFLGKKEYKNLPFYLSNWDVAMLPFLLDDSTKYISPTKVPEYLSAFKPVLSTPITDVVNDYGRDALVTIVSDAGEFADQIDQALLQGKSEVWRKRVDMRLRRLSWDRTWREMEDLMHQTYCRCGDEAARIP